MERCKAPKIVRLSLHIYLFPRSFFSPFHYFPFSRFYATSSSCSDKPHTWGVYILKCTYPTIPGGFFLEEACYNYFLSIKLALYMCRLLTYVFSSPLYAPLWLKFLPSWVAWLLWLCPTFPLVWLGHKGSTSMIVTAGLSRRVPQMGEVES